MTYHLSPPVNQSQVGILHNWLTIIKQITVVISSQGTRDELRASHLLGIPSPALSSFSLPLSTKQ